MKLIYYIYFFTFIFYSNSSLILKNKFESDLCEHLSDEMVSRMNDIIIDSSKVLGKGGFGLIFEYDDKALKVLKMNIKKKHKVKSLEAEIQISKDLFEMQEQFHHVPGYYGCYEFTSAHLPEIDTVFKSYGMERETETVSEEPDEPQFIYIGILMERLETGLDKYIKNDSFSMTIIEKIQLAKNLAFHLNFLNETAHKTHCDIKSENIMINHHKNKILYMQDKYLGSYLNYPEKRVMYTSRIIDFGGVVDKSKSCSVYTMSYTPIDDLIDNGNILSSNVNSSKNDIFAWGTILSQLFDPRNEKAITLANLSLYQSVKEVIEFQNEIHKEQFSSMKNELVDIIRNLGVNGIKEITFGAIQEQLGELLGNWKDLLVNRYKKMYEDGDSLETSEILKNLFIDSEKLMEILNSIYSDQFEYIKRSYLTKAKYEGYIQIMSYLLTQDNFEKFNQYVEMYQSINSDFIDLIKKTFNFKKEERPSWNSLNHQLGSLESRYNKMNKELQEISNAQYNKKMSPEFTVLEKYMNTLKNSYAQKINKLRVLAKGTNDQDLNQKDHQLNDKNTNSENEIDLMRENILKNIKIKRSRSMIGPAVPSLQNMVLNIDTSEKKKMKSEIEASGIRIKNELGIFIRKQMKVIEQEKQHIII